MHVWLNLTSWQLEAAVFEGQGRSLRPYSLVTTEIRILVVKPYKATNRVATPWLRRQKAPAGAERASPHKGGGVRAAVLAPWVWSMGNSHPACNRASV